MNESVLKVGSAKRAMLNEGYPQDYEFYKEKDGNKVHVYVVMWKRSGSGAHRGHFPPVWIATYYTAQDAWGFDTPENVDWVMSLWKTIKNHEGGDDSKFLKRMPWIPKEWLDG